MITFRKGNITIEWNLPPKIVGILRNDDNHLEKPRGAFYVILKFCCEPCGQDFFVVV